MRRKRVIPVHAVYPGSDLASIRQQVDVAADRCRQRGDLGENRVVIMKVHRNVISRAKIIVDANVVVLPMIGPSAADVGIGNRRNVVVQSPTECRCGEKLKPLLGQRILKTGVVGANHVGVVPVTSHELVAKIREVLPADRLVRIVARIDSRRRWIEDRDQISLRVDPVREVALPLLHGRDAVHRVDCSAANRPSFHIDEKERLILR